MIIALVVLVVFARRWKYAQQAQRSITASNQLYLSVKRQLQSLETAHNLLPPERRFVQRLSDEELAVLWREFNGASREHNNTAVADAELLGLWVSVRELKERRDMYLRLASVFEGIERRIRNLMDLMREIDELIPQTTQTRKEVKAALARLNIHVTEQPNDLLKEVAADPVYTRLLELEEQARKLDNMLELTLQIQGQQQSRSTLGIIRDNYLLLLERYGVLDGEIADCYLLVNQIADL